MKKSVHSGHEGSILSVVKIALLTASVLVLIIVGGIALWFYGSGMARVEAPPQPQQPLPVAQQATPEPPVAVGAQTSAPAVTKPVAPPVAATNLIQTPLPRKAEVVQRLTPAKPPLVVRPGIRRDGATNAPNPYATFKTTSERAISQLLRTTPGNPVVPAIPLGPNFDQDFAESLKNLIVIYETDTQEVENHKLAVGWMKDEMRKMVEAGDSPTKIMTEYRNYLNEVAAMRADMQRQLSAFKKEDNIKAAEVYLVEANKILQEYGAKPLVLTPVITRRNTP